MVFSDTGGPARFGLPTGTFLWAAVSAKVSDTPAIEWDRVVRIIPLDTCKKHVVPAGSVCMLTLVSLVFRSCYQEEADSQAFSQAILDSGTSIGLACIDMA